MIGYSQAPTPSIMADHSTLDYPRMMVDALRAVVRRSLRYAVDHGLPGAHHFYIAFDTCHEGVSMPASLRDRYPQTMTIVLQHDYSALDCDDDGFSVILRFGGRPANLSIPFDAILSFSDPSVEFELVFPMPPRLVEQAERGLLQDVGALTAAAADDEDASAPDSQVEARFGLVDVLDDAQPDDAGEDEDGDDDTSGPSNVVAFDRARRRR